jgi:hypothetical protein
MLDGMALAHFLRQIAAIVEKMDQRELNHFIREFKLLKLAPKSAPRLIGKRKDFGKIDAAALERIWARLRTGNTRQEGLQLLDAQQFTRSELAKLAKISNVHTTKDDNVPQIKEKLVEALIGARLGSKAIRGE